MSFNIRTKYEGPGVYAIIDIDNFCAYVGSADNILRRAKSHKSSLKSGKHHAEKLQKDFNSKHKFDFVLIEKTNCSQRKRLLKEYCYIYEMLQAGFILYNTYGNNEKIKDIVIHNTLIVNCNYTYIDYFLMNKYKYYKYIKRKLKKQPGQLLEYVPDDLPADQNEK